MRTEALLDLWQVGEISACDEGRELASSFLIVRAENSRRHVRACGLQLGRCWTFGLALNKSDVRAAWEELPRGPG